MAFCLSIAFGSFVSAEKQLTVDLFTRKIFLHDGKNLLAEYPIGVAKSKEFLTPRGNFQILEKDDSPGWANPFKPNIKINPGIKNPLGTRWMGFYYTSDKKVYGIHGTDSPNSIGKMVSHGCIRMLNKDIEELFEKVEVNTPVRVTFDQYLLEARDEDLLMILKQNPYDKTPFITPEDVKERVTIGYSEYEVDDKAVRSLIETNLIDQPRVIGSLKTHRQMDYSNRQSLR